MACGAEPFSATVTITVKRELKDGSIWQGVATSLIARDSQGNDPRKGDFTTTVAQLDRTEPAGELFVVPAGFRIVDVTPQN